jgi:hypothetical protein
LPKTGNGKPSSKDGRYPTQTVKMVRGPSLEFGQFACAYAANDRQCRSKLALFGYTCGSPAVKRYPYKGHVTGYIDQRPGGKDQEMIPEYM